LIKQKINEWWNWLSRKRASRIIRKHLIKKVPRNFELQDGIPPGCILYNIPNDTPCWTVWIPPEDRTRMGDDHIICVSKKSGKVIYDGRA